MRKLAVIKNKEIRMIKVLTDAEWDKLLLCIQSLGAIQREITFIDPMIESFEECVKLIKAFEKKELSLQKLGNQINRAVLNYLATIRSFLDHWETYIKRKFGKRSDMERCFKEITAEQYDREFSYRFIYYLRNYVLHCEMPISHVTSSFINENTSILDVQVDRDRLLSNFDWKEAVRDELERMPKTFDIIPHLANMNECLAKIHYVLIYNRFDKQALMLSLEMLEFQSRYREYEGQFTLLEHDDKFHTPNMSEVIKQEGKMGLKMHYFSTKLAEKIVSEFIKGNEDNIKIFNIKGICKGQEENDFPKFIEKNEEGQFIFTRGSEFIRVDGEMWVRLISKYSFLNQDGIDKLFVVYVRAGFSNDDRNELVDIFNKLFYIWKHS